MNCSKMRVKMGRESSSKEYDNSVEKLEGAASC